MPINVSVMIKQTSKSDITYHEMIVHTCILRICTRDDSVPKKSNYQFKPYVQALSHDNTVFSLIRCREQLPVYSSTLKKDGLKVEFQYKDSEFPSPTKNIGKYHKLFRESKRRDTSSQHLTLSTYENTCSAIDMPTGNKPKTEHPEQMLEIMPVLMHEFNVSL
jgi:hypothetical protein